MLANAAERVRAGIARQADRAFLWLVVAFGAGIALFFSWQNDPSVWITAGTCVAAIGLFPMRGRWPVLQFAALAVFAFGLGHGAAQLRTTLVATPLLERESRPVVISGLVEGAEKRADNNRVVLTDVILPGITHAQTPRRLRMTIPSSHGIPRVGERISVLAVLRPGGMPAVPDGFQFQRYLYFAGIGGVGYTLGRWQLDATQPDLSASQRFHAWGESLRRVIGERIMALVPGEHGAVAAALVNGEQGAIPEDLQEAYRVSGLAHLLSISGLHMSLLAAVVFFVVRRALALFPAIALRIDTKKTAAWAGLAATGFYLVISGMSVPAVRAFMMIAVVMTAILLDRTALSMRTIAWAAVLLMAIFPEALVGASFQMSFLAVLALIALYEQAWLRIAWRNAEGQFLFLRAVGVYVAGLVITDIVAGGATSLFAAYHFNRVPTYSALINLIAMPLTAVWIMPLALFGLMLMPLGWDAFVFQLMGAGVAVLDNLVRAVAAWPHAQVHIPPMSAEIMGLAALGFIFICIWKGRARWFGIFAIAPALLQPFLSAPPDILVDDTARVFAVSDGQGRLVLSPGRHGAFVRTVWTDRYGKSDMAWPKAGEPDEDLGLSCDADGCVVARNGRKASLAFTAAALAEDCGTADVLVSAVPVRDFCHGSAIDRFRLLRDGAHAVWLGENGVRIRSVAKSTGNRIWMRGVSVDPDQTDAEKMPDTREFVREAPR